MLRATKVRIYPTDEQAVFLNAQFGAVRFIYNKALYLKKRQYKRHGISINPLSELKPLIAVAKKSRKYAWLKDYDSIALQEAVRNLDKAYKNFFDKSLPAGFPQSKKKHGKQSSYHCMGIKVSDNTIKIPKLSPIKARIHREIKGIVKSITLSRSNSGQYYASILVDDEIAEAKTKKHLKSSELTGIDLGLTDFFIQSNGDKQANPRFLKRAYRNLRRKQKALCRTQKGSKGRAKARLQLAKAHEKVANARNDFQHKLSKQLVDENQAVIVETLKVKNMLKNRKLAKHIADVSWHSFINKLEYKAEQYGKHLVKIDQWYASSKTCSCCDHKVEKLPLNIRFWQCPSCNTEHDRDINAAINIKKQGILKLKAEGLSVSADGGLRKSDHVSVAA